jgi:hypothetical protein
LRTFALTAATGAIAVATAAARPASAAIESALLPPGATHLDAINARLARAPRRRDFKTVPMILDHPEQWDHEALTEVLAYRPAPKQVWDNTDIGGPWLNMMRKRPQYADMVVQTSGFSRRLRDARDGTTCAVRSGHVGQISTHETGR